MTPMRFTFAESMCDPSHYLPLAIAAEQAGYHSFTVPDSILYPKESDTKYPYTEEGSREFLEGRPFIESFILIASLAAVTERLRFTTFVLKLPIRHPVHVAKQAMSLAVMSHNRFGLGVGLSPWPEDFRVTDTEWKGRGRRMDEMIDIVRGLSKGEFYEHQGEFYDIESIKMTPAPTEPIPILIGGHSDAALRRAARLGNGWMHAGGDDVELERMMNRITEMRKEYGREEEPFENHVISLEGFTVDGARRLEDLGVTDLVVGFRNAYEPDVTPLEEKLAALESFANDVIAKV